VAPKRLERSPVGRSRSSSSAITGRDYVAGRSTEGRVPGSPAVEGFGISGAEFTVPMEVASKEKISSICQAEVLLTQKLLFLPFSINGL
jgi:hypothetical protein